MSRNRRAVAVGVESSLVALLLGTACVPAENEYVVDTTNDFPDANPGDGICAGRSGSCSLRAAVEETNMHPSGDGVHIVVPAGTYEITGELVLTHDEVEVRGNSRFDTIIRQVGAGRIFTITNPGDIVIRGVSLTGGNLSSSASGGAIFVDGSGFYRVTLNQIRIYENTAGFLGGGLYAQGDQGIVNVLASVIEDNDSTGEGCTDGGGQSGGGGLMVNGPTLLLQRTEVRDNCGSNGGGVRIQGGSNHLITLSTIAGNGSATKAAGLEFVNAEGEIIDSTIALNTGPVAAGVYVSGGELVIESATIANNTSVAVDGAAAGTGGILTTNGAQVSLMNTAVAGNQGAFQVDDCSGTFSSAGGNFIGEHDAPCAIVAQATDILDGGDPLLGGLLSNGGLTRTMLPLSNSPLVDQGVPGCGPIDQRSLPAPVADCDIGAAERQ